jgi:predicted nucleic acid-binding Zn ribbon protein
MGVGMSTSELSGVDLARVALQAAKHAAKNRPADAAGGRASTRRRRGRAVRGDGRDPVGLGAAVTGLMADRAWEVPAAGGSVIDRWPDLAPELVGKVAPVRFDAETGRLDLLPVSAAFATQMRLFGAQLVERINAKTGNQAVRSIRVLPPGTASGRTLAGAVDGPQLPAGQDVARQPEVPVKTRDNASPGYHPARAAYEATKKAPRRVDSGVQAAVARQDRCLRTKREPAAAFRGGQAAIEDVQTKAATAEDSRRRALRRARTERAGGRTEGPKQLGRTA